MESILARLVHLAPLIVLDTAQSALDELRVDTDPSNAAEDASPPQSVTKRLADATSRFVLEEARGESHLSVALAAATGDDRRNIEVCRLARELGFSPVVGIVIDPSTSQDYVAQGARAIVRAQILGSVVEQALRYDGLVIASTVGQGRGEIIEFVVLPSSPAIGVPLSQLHAEGWRIAAVYRGSELVIPMGTTMIRAEDRVLVIGDPEILPSIAEQLRIGVPQFPLRHGNSVVAYLPAGRIANVEEEAELLAQKTRATALRRIYPGAKPSKEALLPTPAPSAQSPRPAAKQREDMLLAGDNLRAHIEQLRELRPGVVIASPMRRSWGRRMLGRSGSAAELCTAMDCPVLFARGTPHHARVVHALIAGIADLASADTAIDLARMLSLPLVVVRVILPPYVQAPDQQTDQVGDELQRRARLYGLQLEWLQIEGNPVRELVRLAQPDDLLILSRKPTRRDSFTSPDVAMRVAESARCSTLILTVQRP